MYIKQICLTIIASAIALLPISSSTIFAQTSQVVPTKRTPSSVPEIVYSPPTTFFCGGRDRKDNKGKTIQKQVPTTIIETAKGEVVVYYWTGTIYSNPTETALTRCNRVASILDSFNYLKQLNLIKLGEMNKKPTICVSNRLESPCSKLIFTLEPNEKPTNVLKDLQIAMKGLPIKIRIIPIDSKSISNILRGDNNVSTRSRLPQVYVEEEEIVFTERNSADVR